MTFHDSPLVSNETTNLACFTVNAISVFLSFGCERVMGEQRTLPPVFILKCFPSPFSWLFFNVIIHINQGADQLYKVKHTI